MKNYLLHSGALVLTGCSSAPKETTTEPKDQARTVKVGVIGEKQRILAADHR